MMVLGEVPVAKQGHRREFAETVTTNLDLQCSRPLGCQILDVKVPMEY